MKSNSEKSDTGNQRKNDKNESSSTGYLSSLKKLFNITSNEIVASADQSSDSKDENRELKELKEAKEAKEAKIAKNNSISSQEKEKKQKSKKPKKSEIIQKTQKTVSEKSKNQKNSSDSKDQILPLPNFFSNLENKLKILKTEKNKIIMAVGIFISILSIVYGLFLFSAPVEKVSDNVVFGEKAIFSMILILIGILILAAIFAGRLLDKTFLKKIFKELEIAEKKSTESNDKESKKTVSNKKADNNLKEDKNV